MNRIPGHALLVFFHLALQLAVADLLVADEIDAPDLDVGALLQLERQVNELRPARHLGDLVGDVAELKPFLAEHVADDSFDLADQAGIDERVEADFGVGFLQLLVDLRGLDLLRADVVHDLDPLALLHVVGDDLAEGAVGKLVVGGFNPQVVEEVGVPQPVEVVHDHFLGRVVVRHPDTPRRDARLQLDVIEVGRRFDHRLVALRLEARRNEQHHGPRIRRRLRRGPGLLAAHGHGRQVLGGLRLGWRLCSRRRLGRRRR